MIYGLEHDSYTVNEEDGVVEVCTSLKSGIPRSPFNITLMTTDGDATSKFASIFLSAHCQNLIVKVSMCFLLQVQVTTSLPWWSGC